MYHAPHPPLQLYIVHKTLVYMHVHKIYSCTSGSKPDWLISSKLRLAKTVKRLSSVPHPFPPMDSLNAMGVGASVSITTVACHKVITWTLPHFHTCLRLQCKSKENKEWIWEPLQWSQNWWPITHVLYMYIQNTPVRQCVHPSALTLPYPMNWEYTPMHPYTRLACTLPPAPSFWQHQIKVMRLFLTFIPMLLSSN